MAYVKTNFSDGGTYGADVFNKIENGIVALESSSGGSVFYKKQTVNLANAMKKLRTSNSADICFFGDSVLYGYYKGENAVEEDCIPDNGVSYSAKYGKIPTRNPVTIYNTFLEAMQKAFGSAITIKKKLYSGHTAKWAYSDYNASNSNFVIINFGINDALGAHVATADPEYLGNIDEFLKYYRLIIEREITAGTAVVLLTPVKQTLVIESDDTDDRTLVDVYEQATINLAKEYGCPYIDGNEMVKNFGIDLCEDFTHYSAEGNKSIGYRLASVFIGQSPLVPIVASSGTYLGVHPQLDNVNIIGAVAYDFTDISPNLPTAISSGNLVHPVSRVNGGLQATLSDGGRVVWSFYCPHDGMVVIPSLYTEYPNAEIAVNLDFAAKQGKWNNFWNAKGILAIERSYEEPSTIAIVGSDLFEFSGGGVYGMSVINSKSQPILMITTKGWHTVEIMATFPAGGATTFSVAPPVPTDGAIAVFGIDILSLNDYKRIAVNE